jgi:hypothetical protein
MHGLRDLRELERITQEHEVLRRRGGGERIGQRQLTRLVDNEHVDGGSSHVGAGEQPRGARNEVVLALGAGRIVGDVGDAPKPRVVGIGHLADGLERREVALVIEHLEDPLEQVVDGVVTHRRDAHPPTGADEAVDDVGAPVRLAGPRWPLDRDAASVEMPDPPTHRLQVVGEHSTWWATARGEHRVVPAEQAQRRRARNLRARDTEHARGEIVEGGGLRVWLHPIVVGDGVRE